MKRILLCALFACHHTEPAAPPPVPAAATSPSGSWTGAVELPGQKLDIAIAFDGHGAGTIDIPQQGATGLALANAKLAGDTVSFELTEVGAKFTGTLRGDAIAGSMTQSGQTFPFSLSRSTGAFVPPPPPKEPLSVSSGAALIGRWTGDAFVELAGDGGLVTGTAALAHGCARTTVTDLALDGHRVRFRAGGAYVEGEVAGDAITGTLHTSAATSAFTLAREAPLHEVEVSIPSGAVTLAGTLTLPDGVAKPPVAVLVTGSGPQDRDECVIGVRPFRVLSAYLARHGIASLRYDDRGTAHSTGDFKPATAADFADDAEAVVKFLRARTDVGRIGIIGHSEGGLIGPMVAARNHDVTFVVLWAGPGLPLPEVDIEQTGDITRADGGDADTEVALEKQVIAALRASTTEADFRTKLRAIKADDAWIDGKVAENWSPWIRWYLDYDPAATLAKVKCPLLAINGGTDVQVRASTNLPAIKKALPAATIVELPGLNHLFQPSKTGAVSQYATNPPIDEAVLRTTAEWIAGTVYRSSTSPR